MERWLTSYDDDVSRGNTDSRITTVLEAGTYTVEATTHPGRGYREFHPDHHTHSCDLQVLSRPGYSAPVRPPSRGVDWGLRFGPAQRQLWPFLHL